MSQIKITIGARLDRSVEETFERIEKMAKKTADAATRATSGGAAGGRTRAPRAVNPELEAARQIHAEQSKLNRQILREQMAAQKEADREARRGAAQRIREAIQNTRAQQREEQKATRERERDERRAIAERERAERRVEQNLAAMQRQRSAALLRSHNAEERELDRLATRTSHRTTRFMFPRPEGAIGYASRTANDLLRGVGVDMSFAGGVARARERETAGAGLANQERIATGSTRGGGYWSGVSQDVGAALSIDPAQVTALMRAFTGKTGEFAETPDIAKRLGSMSKAAGADLEEMGDAAGYVYNQLKGMPDAANLTLSVMRGIVGQTAVGAVEMKDYASQMGRIAANAKQFQGNAATNILELSALTQLSIAEGGATSGADAARSIAAFANTTSKGARINKFKKLGVDVFNEQGTQKRPILDIIHDSLIASKGNLKDFTDMWADTLGQKPLKGLVNAYNLAGGGEKGWAAAKEKIAPYMRAQMTEDVEKRNVSDYKKTAEAKAQDFQNKLDKITESLASKLLPAMEELAPLALSIAKAFGNFVAWATENPGKLVALAISASIGRALTESVFRAALERIIKSAAGRQIGADGTATFSPISRRNAAGGLTSLGGSLAAAGTGLAIGTGLAATIDYAGKSQYDEGVKTTGSISKGLVGVHGKDLEEALTDAQNKLNAYQSGKGIVGGAFSGMMNFFGAGDEADVKGLEDLIARKRAELEDYRKTGLLSPEATRDIKAQKEVERWQERKDADYAAAARANAEALKGATLNVRVANMGDLAKGAGGPEVNSSGRRGREGGA